MRPTERAGALIIYDFEEQPAHKRELYDFLDIAFLSSAEEDDQLGRSIGSAGWAIASCGCGATGNGRRLCSTVRRSCAGAGRGRCK